MIVFGTLLAYCLVLGGIVYLTACLYAFSGHLRTPVMSDDVKPTVSIVIAARNEEDNIGSLLDDLMDQDYPRDSIGIFVVDDCSDDRTADVVREYAGRDKRIHLLSSADSTMPYSHKKRAVHTGIHKSDGEIIMTVDADCRVGRGWITGMTAHFVPGVDLTAGEIYVEGIGFTAWFEILDFTGIQTMSAGLMNAGFPVTCNGGNLAYRRAAFDRVGGYGGIGKVVSGDDDLLMQKIAAGNPSSVVYITNRDTAVRVQANDSMRSFLMQRTRWASKIGTYPSRQTVMLLAAFYTFFSAIPIWLAGAFAGLFGWTPLVVALGLKVAGDLLLLFQGLSRRRLWQPLLFFPLAELLHVPYILYVAPRGFFGKFEWSGRCVGSKV